MKDEFFEDQAAACLAPISRTLCSFRLNNDQTVWMDLLLMSSKLYNLLIDVSFEKKHIFVYSF